MAMVAVLPGTFGKPGSGVLRAAARPRRAHRRNVLHQAAPVAHGQTRNRIVSRLVTIAPYPLQQVILGTSGGISHSMRRRLPQV